MDYSIFERLLHDKGATVYQVSKATGIAASTFTDWKNGRSTPKVDKLARIAEYFSLTLDELMGTSSGTRDTESAYRHLRARKMVPVIGVIRAGRPIVTDETMLGHEFADVDDVEEIVSYLMENGHVVSEIKKNKIGLEEYYIELMSKQGGNRK